MHEHKIFNPANIAKLDSDERKKIIPPQLILDSMKINLTDKVLDLGAGVGYFAIPMFDYIKEGSVLALDLSVEMIEELKKRIQNLPAEIKSRINTKVGTIDDLIAENLKFDKILIAFVFHEISDQSLFLKNLKQLLNTDGEITIVEWQKSNTNEGPPLHHRISKEELIKMSIENNYRVDLEKNITQSHYFIRLK